MRIPTMSLSPPYTTRPPLSAITIPSTVPLSCDIKLTPPRPPSLRAEDARCNAAPRAAQSMQRPDTDFVDRLRRHHVETEPAHRQHPRAERKKRNARGRMCRDAAVIAVAPAPRAERSLDSSAARCPTPETQTRRASRAP